MTRRLNFRKKIPLYCDTDGAIFIETAFVLSFLLVPILIGIFEFGLFMYEYTQVVKVVESATLYATKNSANIYAMNPFSSTSIAAAAGATPWNDAISITAGCSCPGSNSGNLTLTPFQGAPLPKCNQSAVCNGNTLPVQPYVLIKTTHPHSYVFMNHLFPNLSASYSNYVRIN